MFNTQRKYYFLCVLDIMLEVVCKVRGNIYAAYLKSDIKASRVALYGKLQNLKVNILFSGACVTARGERV